MTRLMTTVALIAMPLWTVATTAAGISIASFDLQPEGRMAPGGYPGDPSMGESVDHSQTCGFCHETSIIVEEAEHLAAPYYGEVGNPTKGPAPTEPETIGGWHMLWYLPGTCLVHGVCIATTQDLTDVVADAVLSSDVVTIANLVNTADVTINEDRGAVQIAGCDGTTIVGHVPARVDFLEAVERAATQLR